MGIHHVQLACPDGWSEPLHEFYVGLLGLTPVPKPPALAGRGGAWFRSGPMELHLGVESDFRPARKAHPALLVTGLDELVVRLRTAGVSVPWDGRLPGYRRCYVDDPVGNRVELLQPADL